MFILHNIVFLKFIHVLAYNSSIKFILLSSIPFYGYITIFVTSALNGNLGCFYVLNIFNNAVVNIHVQFIVCSYVFFSLG